MSDWWTTALDLWPCAVTATMAAVAGWLVGHRRNRPTSPNRPANSDDHADGERMRELAELLPGIIYEMDSDGRITFINRHGYDLTGYNEDDYRRGFMALDLIHSSDRARAYDNIRARLEGRAIDGHEYTAIRKDGSTFPVYAHSTPILRNGRSVGLRGVIMDISEAKSAARALDESQRQLEAILNAIDEAVIATDRSFRIVRCNHHAGNMFPGVEIGQAIDRSIALVDNRHETYPMPLRDVLDERQTVALPPGTRTVYPDGSLVPVVGALSPVFDTDHVVTGVVLAIRDISSRQNLEQQLRQSQKMEAIGQLAGGIAHDFNNFLTGIMGYAELIQESLDGDDANRAYATSIISTAQRASDLTAQLLAFSRRRKPVSMPHRIHSLIEEIRGLLQRTISPTIVLETRLDAPEDIVRCDGSQIQSALLNLAINARDAMPEGGHLDIDTDNEAPEGDRGRWMRIRIRDTGCGMDERIKARIFEPFFTTKQTGRGTGLGLAAVYGIVTSHGGRVDVSSEPGAGSEFVVHLPLDRQMPEEPKALTPTDRLRQLPRRGRILLVDDEENIRTVACRMLERLGYDMSWAADGQVALDLMEHNGPYDLIILDVVMPVLDGRKTLARIREHWPDQAVLIASGFGNEYDMGSIDALGIQGSIAKPFSLRELRQTVDDLLLSTEDDSQGSHGPP